ncbi:hypothetical protein FOA52_008762 [Chlamydomonas sp. UWO 241]|nr:hypothetical protein FOA52_008762 [Chlamydomonas sp. UWO 241]
MSKPLHYDATGQLLILSVDDDQVNLMVIEQLLQPCGWKIVSTLDGEEAIATLDEPTWPDLVLLDYTLHNGDCGDEVCRKMRTIFGETPVPIVMCTAMTAGSSKLDDCKDAGASDVLLKPYERTVILSMVERHCGAKARQAPPPAPPAAAAAPAIDIVTFATNLGMEYCGRKLQSAGFTVELLRGADDAALRAAGIVVKGQRDKLLQAAAQL